MIDIFHIEKFTILEMQKYLLQISFGLPNLPPPVSAHFLRNRRTMLCKLFSIILLACALSTVVDGSAEKPRIRAGGARPAQRLDCFTKPNSPGGVREDLEDLGEGE